MAQTGCRCGVRLTDHYVPGGVCWDVFPKWQVERSIQEHPDHDIVDAMFLLDKQFNNDHGLNLWLCRRCRRLHIWNSKDKYVGYRKDTFDHSISLTDILDLEEWLAYSDWDYETDDNLTLKKAMEHPPRPYRFFLSEDHTTIYVFNTDNHKIEYTYKEEVRELDDGLYRDEHGLYRHTYKDNVYVGSYYLDGTPVDYSTPDGILSNAVYGAIIGDALGVPFEFKERGSFQCTGMIGYGTHNQPAGTWSDDSSLILATCKSIKDNNGKINIEDMKNKFREWLLEGKYTPFGEVFDVGNATRTAILTGQSQDGEYSNGNGSLMRILPLAFIDCTDDDVRQVSAITHGHWISTEACVIFINIFKKWLEVRRAREWITVKDIVHNLNLSKPFDRIPRIDSLQENDIDSSGYVVSTLEAAIWCVLTSDYYEECLKKAVNLGNDTDTVACVAGALGSLEYGFDSISDPWVNAIQNNDLIQECLF